MEKDIIVGSFVERPGEFMSWLYEHQWSEWEIITIAVIVVFIVLWIVTRQRKRAFRNIHGNKFLENTPVIGSNLGVRKKRRHLIRDFKKARLAASQQGHTNQQKSTKRTESEKLHEQIRQLQRENIKHKQNEVRLKQQVAELTAAKDELQRELVELKQIAQPAEVKDEVEPISEEQLQPEISENKQIEQRVITDNKQAEQDIEERKVEASTKDKQVEKKSPRMSKTYEDLHRIVDDVKQKLCRECKEWKPESEFHKNASSKDGLAGSCKTCKAEAAKKYRKRRKTAQE